MKFTVIFASCFIFTIIYQVEGGLVKDLFGKVQKTAEVVREDIKKVWRPDSVTESSTSATDDKNGVTSTTAANVPEVKPEDKKEVGNVAPLSGENAKKSDDVSKPTTPEAKPEEKEVKHEETTVVPSSTTTDKEGRENFKANCATGYGRTPDGRCKPTF